MRKSKCSSSESVCSNQGLTRREFIAAHQLPTVPGESRPPFTPGELAERWRWHPESVRRAVRDGRFDSIIVGRRRLIPASEVERVEREGFIARAA